ncbi:lipopolysaccharide biosynthesis protein [Chondromyces crocatus]|uniref:Integral membrane protein n=1 Tax=Chondromyces crocatus TaxID=52 RepID=A0A0K1ENU4_CHOCO|nr:lipopolysaccharide biosynthesis protein [Chondromyces crocatus]AKT42531.1 integral membrane protein [Chondromyces crocatus]
MPRAEPPPPSPSPASSPPPAPSPTTARAAGRGGLAIAVAKVSFILFGFIQQLLLPWLLGVDGYGALSIVLADVSVVNNVIVATGIQGVSRAVASAPPGEVQHAFARALRLHAALAVAVATAFFFAAPHIAAFVKAPHVTLPLQVTSGVILLYGTYAPLVGALNGQRRFIPQAALDIAYGAIRLLAIAAGAILFIRAGHSGVLGATAGFVTAAAIIVPIALLTTGIGKPGHGGTSARDHLAYLLPLAVSQAFLNLLMQTDLNLFRRTVGQAATDLALTGQAADALTGAYRGMQLFSFLPYQLLMSVSFILFPLLAQAHAGGDTDAVRRYTRTGVRIAMLLTGLLCAPIAGLGPHVLRMAFPEEIWTQGGTALRVHALGMGAFAILGIFCAALTSLRRERWTATLTGIAVALVAMGCLYAVPRAPFGPQMLLHSALATGAALTLAALVAAALVRFLVGEVVALAVPLRVVAAVAITIALGTQLPWLGKLLVPLEAALLGAIYLALLTLFGEIGRADLALVKQAFGRRSASRPA